MKQWKTAAVAAGALFLPLFAGPANALEQQVAVELVIAVDTSASVNQREYDLQMEGIALALRDPEVINMITSQTNGVAITVTHWSTGHLNEQVVPWMHLRSEDDALAMSRLVGTIRRNNFGNSTGLGHAIEYAARLIRFNGFAGLRRKIDVSGDGRNNSGIHPVFARDRAVLDGITVNGLPILDGDPGLEDYYRKYVMGGPGSFVIAAFDFEDFARAMKVKLLRELEPAVSQVPPRQRVARRRN